MTKYRPVYTGPPMPDEFPGIEEFEKLVDAHTEYSQAPTDTGKDHDPIPPDGCNCASFWTIRGTHKSDCPLAQDSSDTCSKCDHGMFNHATDKDKGNLKCMRCRRKGGPCWTEYDEEMAQKNKADANLDSSEGEEIDVIDVLVDLIAHRGYQEAQEDAGRYTMHDRGPEMAKAFYKKQIQALIRSERQTARADELQLCIDQLKGYAEMSPSIKELERLWSNRLAALNNLEEKQ